MDDLISRQEVLTFIEKSVSEYGDRYSVDMLNMWGLFTHVVKDMPSAQKKGHWVDGKRMKMDGTFYWFRQCSACDYERNDDDSDKDTNFCPNCGADMREER